ncbi:NAD(P)H-binding protein [Georgenia sp. EYE_87]|uniref:NAD(P)H-binding protein n=1 Tax=Georgenia sp. EYE_87 TaxID=2853448 RepID=UPI002005E9B6|nr:NAD(P)H-binding protein [Georgenia sp. EYE_87]MCK6209142.1 NAD(P)H-binding protein [Georgenia sp. EYE_87]
MRVFVAGGSGVLGRRLVLQLVALDHQVTAATTSPARLGMLEHLGAEAVVMDGPDPASVGEAVAAARPDAIVNEMTAISRIPAGKPDLKHSDRWFAVTNRLRTESDGPPAGRRRGGRRVQRHRAGLRQLERRTKAKSDLTWVLRSPSWRQGFREELAATGRARVTDGPAVSSRE